tara:strand:- start:2789 stop:3046 length:258 start_codon:yes stop_codon:yes gene_type:complete
VAFLINEYVEKWEKVYTNGIPDELPNRIEFLNKAPSYKSIVRCLLKNDIGLVGLGCSRPKKSKVYTKIKRRELIERGVLLEVDLL